MKEWQITFLDQKGVQTRLSLPSAERPTEEQAALAIRAHLFPVMEKAGLNDFEGRSSAPTAKWLEEQSGVKITAIEEA